MLEVIRSTEDAECQLCGKAKDGIEVRFTEASGWMDGSYCHPCFRKMVAMRTKQESNGYATKA